jgi:hypothetical protein
MQKGNGTRMSQELLQTLHDRWAADATLNGLLPSSRVWIDNYPATGGDRVKQDREPDYPYAVMWKDDETVSARFNSGEQRTIDVEIDVFASREGGSVARQIVDRIGDPAGPYNRQQFDITNGGGRVLNVTVANFNDPDPIDDDGILLFECPLIMMVQL